MTAGDILLVSGGGDKWARIIRFITRSQIHHAAIDLGDGTAASAEAPAVKIKPISDWENVTVVSVGTVEQRAKVAWFAANMVGRRYSRLGFVLAGLDALGVIPGILQQPLADLADETGVTCGSMVDACYLAVGIDLVPGPSALTWPGELAQLLPTDDPDRHLHFEVLPDGRTWLSFPPPGHVGSNFASQEES